MRNVRVVGSSCLDVCPKRGATLVTTAEKGITRTVVARDSIGDPATWDAIGIEHTST
jgi:hypothetical protein